MSNLCKNDFFKQTEEADKQRRKSDIFLKLLTDTDNVELQRHVLGIIADAASATESNQEGLVYQLYGNVFNIKQKQALRSLQDCELSDFSSVQIRLECHFVLFITLATSNEFVQYVMQNSRDSTAVKYFIEEILQTHVSNLMKRVDSCDFDDESLCLQMFSEFVENCRCDYMCYCMSGSK